MSNVAGPATCVHIQASNPAKSVFIENEQKDMDLTWHWEVQQPSIHFKYGGVHGLVTSRRNIKNGNERPDNDPRTNTIFTMSGPPMGKLGLS